MLSTPQGDQCGQSEVNMRVEDKVGGEARDRITCSPVDRPLYSIHSEEGNPWRMFSKGVT